jgi:hypothetical protein
MISRRRMLALLAAGPGLSNVRAAPQADFSTGIKIVSLLVTVRDRVANSSMSWSKTISSLRKTAVRKASATFRGDQSLRNLLIGGPIQAPLRAEYFAVSTPD